MLVQKAMKKTDPKIEKRWRAIFEEFHLSQLPFKKFCEREKLSPTSFQYWRSTLRKRDEANGIVSKIKAGENRPCDMEAKRQFWLKMIAKAQKYNGNITVFCDDNGIASGSLYHWEKRLMSEGLTAGFSEKNALVPMRIVDKANSGIAWQQAREVDACTDQRVEIITRNGDAICLPKDFPVVALIEIARGLFHSEC